MSNSTVACSVCLNSNTILLEVSATDTNKVKLSSKLNLCVPKVDWSGDCCICPKCIEQLEIAYTFCRLCLQSFEVRRQQNLRVINEEPPLESKEISNFQIKSCLNEDEIPTSSLMSIDEADGLTSVDDVVQRLNRCVENCMEGIPSIENMPMDDIDVKYTDLNNVCIKTEESCDIGSSLFRKNCAIISDSEDLGVSPCTPPEVLKVTKATVDRLLPTKSTTVYEASYRRFMKWCHEKNVKVYSENVLLTYFSEMGTKLTSSSMWSHYSMIRSVLNIKQDVDISKYIRLRAYLKKHGEGYRPKKRRTLTKDQFHKFLAEAPHNKYLAIKVILIFGISGGCTCSELVNMRTVDIEDLGSLLLIKIPDSKTHKIRTFTILEDEYLTIYRNYASLRPAGFNEKRFFLKYRNGLCYRMVMGIHTIGGAAKEVASYLKLPNWKEYTGHCLRRTSATLLLDKGV